MSNNKYADELKNKAVSQVIDFGESIADVSIRLGVSIESLYQWVKSAELTEAERQEEELMVVRRENKRLKDELRKAQSEREILKSAANYYAKE